MDGCRLALAVSRGVQLEAGGGCPLRADQSMVLLREQAAGGSPRAAVVVRAGGAGVAHLQRLLRHSTNSAAGDDHRPLPPTPPARPYPLLLRARPVLVISLHPAVSV